MFFSPARLSAAFLFAFPMAKGDARIGRPARRAVRHCRGARGGRVRRFRQRCGNQRHYPIWTPVRGALSSLSRHRSLSGPDAGQPTRRVRLRRRPSFIALFFFAPLSLPLLFIAPLFLFFAEAFPSPVLAIDRPVARQITLTDGLLAFFLSVFLFCVERRKY